MYTVSVHGKMAVNRMKGIDCLEFHSKLSFIRRNKLPLDSARTKLPFVKVNYMLLQDELPYPVIV